MTRRPATAFNGSWGASALALLLCFTGGCATAPVSLSPQDDQAVTQSLSQAASLLAQPGAPERVNLRDDAQVEWNLDKSMKITLHQMWAVRVAPEQPLPPLATLNLESQDLTVDKIQKYKLGPDGTYAPESSGVSVSSQAPQPGLPPALSKIATFRPPDLSAGEALDLTYTLTNRTNNLLDKGPTKQHPVPAEPSFAFRWNDYTPCLQRQMTLRLSAQMPLYAVRLRQPANLAISETGSPLRTLHFEMTPAIPPLPQESFQPPLQDLAPLTAFTVYKSWEEALLPYRQRVKAALAQDPAAINAFVAEAGDNTADALLTRVTRLKNALHQKVDWADTGLPIYLNPDRPFAEILSSGKGSSHDLALLLMAALQSIKLNPQLFLYRQAGSGELIGDLPALSQMDGVLIGIPQGKDMLWLDPTEPLAAPGTLPLQALGVSALAVLPPLAWQTTPPFGAKDHRKERDILMEFNARGDLSCTVDLQAFGSADLALRQFFRATSDDKRKELVLRGLNKRFPGAQLTDYSYGDYRDTTQPLRVKYAFTIPQYAQFQPKGGFNFYPVIFEDIEDFLATLRETRVTPIVVPQSFNSITRVVVKLPKGYKVGDLPKDGSISNSVAEFISDSKVQFGTLSYERYMGLKKRTILPGDEYKQLYDFYQAALGQDRSPFKALPARQPL
ncbi:MAG TPA: hypothetical protein VMU88_00390 [bacterium]|nr:hypothetical protein [bacterium]